MEYLIAYLIIGMFFAIVCIPSDKDFSLRVFILRTLIWPLILLFALLG